jgi:hypothetical protein
MIYKYYIRLVIKFNKKGEGKFISIKLNIT